MHQGTIIFASLLRNKVISNFHDAQSEGLFGQKGSKFEVNFRTKAFVKHTTRFGEGQGGALDGQKMLVLL